MLVKCFKVPLLPESLAASLCNLVRMNQHGLENGQTLSTSFPILSKFIQPPIMVVYVHVYLSFISSYLGFACIHILHSYVFHWPKLICRLNKAMKFIYVFHPVV